VPPRSAHSEPDAWLIWLAAPGIGHGLTQRALAAHGSIAALLTAGASAWRTLGLEAASIEALEHPDASRIEAARDWLRAPARRLITIADPDYPPQLRRAPAPPPALFVAGDPYLLWRAQLAIVGSRAATADGIATTRDFAATLARAGLAIVSGLAEGIDGAAHAATLQAGGITIAVLGTGPERVFPRQHAALAAEIARTGAVVSEFLPGEPGSRQTFPRRNRVIAGLALGVLVVEAAQRSGALITARQASEAGREVFAIPGSIHAPLKRGCHRLIRDGAKLVERASDVLEELAPLARELGTELERVLAGEKQTTHAAPQLEQHVAREDPDYVRLLAQLGHDPVAIDTLAQRSGLTAAALSSMLLLLELDGRVVAHAGGRYALVP
jgi:DNA processing protein